MVGTEFKVSVRTPISNRKIQVIFCPSPISSPGRCLWFVSKLPWILDTGRLIYVSHAALFHGSKSCRVYFAVIVFLRRRCARRETRKPVSTRMTSARESDWMWEKCCFLLAGLAGKGQYWWDGWMKQYQDNGCSHLGGPGRSIFGKLCRAGGNRGNWKGLLFYFCYTDTWWPIPVLPRTGLNQ